MNDTQQGTSWALQGCLVGSVVLFVVLLIAMMYLAFGRFREHTAPQEDVVLMSRASAPAAFSPSLRPELDRPTPATTPS